MADAWAFMQAEMAKKPRANPNVRVLGGTPLEGISDIPMSPADPRWKEKIQPPADPGPQQVHATPVHEVQREVSSTGVRVAIYFAREGYRLGIERAPDWEIEGQVHRVTEAALREFLPILAKVIKIKDTTGEFYVPYAEEQSSDERGVPDDRPRAAKPRKVRTSPRKAKGDAATGTDHAPDRAGGYPSGLGLEAGDSPFLGSSVLADPEGEDARMVSQFEDPKAREEFERNRKAEAYKKQVELRRQYRLDDDAEDARVGASRDSGG